MAANVFPISNVVIKGVMDCMVAGSFAASLWLANERVVPTSNIAGTANPWV